MDYKDFVVLLGLDTKASGRWIYQKRNEKKTDLSKFLKLAERWRACLPKSKWLSVCSVCARENLFMRVLVCIRLFVSAVRIPEQPLGSEAGGGAGGSGEDLGVRV